MTYKINTVIEKDGHGYFAYAPELKGRHMIYRRNNESIVFPFHTGKTSHPKIVKQVFDCIGICPLPVIG